MGKAAKKHREKVAKRNRRVNQEKYAMNNALNRVMKQMAEMRDKEQTEENLNVTVGGQEVPFSVVDENDFNSIVDFKEENPNMFNFASESDEEQIS